MKKLAFTLISNWLINFFISLFILIIVILSSHIFPEFVFGNIAVRALCLTILICCMSYMCFIGCIITYLAPTATELVKHLNSKQTQSIKKIVRLSNSTPFKVLLTLHFINTATLNIDYFFGADDSNDSP